MSSASDLEHMIIEFGKAEARWGFATGANLEQQRKEAEKERTALLRQVLEVVRGLQPEEDSAEERVEALRKSREAARARALEYRDQGGDAVQDLVNLFDAAPSLQPEDKP